MRRLPSLLLLTALPLGAASCGSSSVGPNPVPSPSPTPSLPPGPVAGRYVLEVLPAATCGLPSARLAFTVDAAAAPTPGRDGVQVLLAGGGPALEAELLATAVTLRGGVGTVGFGAQTNGGTVVSLRTIAEGTVVRATDGRGEITSGVLNGYLALSTPDGPEGQLGSCNAAHSFTLRVP